jgi:hypothetical protein
MDQRNKKSYIVLPYISSMDNVKIGKFYFKGRNAYSKSPKYIRDELDRISTFFRQSETRQVVSFLYLEIDDLGKFTEEKMLDLKKTLQVYKFLALAEDPMHYHGEHFTPYLISPVREADDKEYRMYKLTVDFSNREFWPSHPHSKERPTIVENIRQNSPPHISDKVFNKFYRKISEKKLIALGWYDKTLSAYSHDQKENLLKLSAGFEAFLDIDKSESKKKGVKEVKKLLQKYIKKPELDKAINSIDNYIASMTTRGLAEEIYKLTKSKPIMKWFKNYFYPIGSGIRHGDDVEEQPVSVTKDKKSLWYSEGASKGYLHNVSFGRKLFIFIVYKKFNIREDFSARFEIESMEGDLMADEKRLKDLRSRIDSISIGALKLGDTEEIRSLEYNYTGTKDLVYHVLVRLLLELNSKHRSYLKSVDTQFELITSKELTDEEINDYELFNKYFQALDIERNLRDEVLSIKNIDDEKLLVFRIQELVSFALHVLI